MKPASTCPVRGSIEAHFRGRTTPDQEAAMRAHLPDCEGCRALYERHLLYGELTRRGMPVDGPAGPGAGVPAAGGGAVLVAARAAVGRPGWRRPPA